jgi:ElaB/YqjD/DUF883 family membrane-anchored ribosome-binding protein
MTTQKTPHEHDYLADIKHELNELKKNVKGIKQDFVDQISHTAHKIPEAIHHGEEKVVQAVEANPLATVGIAAAVGFILGAIFTRK